jgi:hypothetical protein
LPAVARAVGEGEITGASEIAEERHRIEDRRVVEHLDSRLPISNNNIGAVTQSPIGWRRS